MTPTFKAMEESHDYAILLDACAKEPIHIPGAIQPFGLLLSVDWPKLEIQNASINCDTILGVPADDLIGRSFVEFLFPDQLQDLQHYLAQDDVQEKTPLSLRLQPPAIISGAHRSGETHQEGQRERHWELSAHRHSGCLILELEPGRQDPLHDNVQFFHQKIRNAVQALQATGSLQQMCDAAVQQVRAITGFDRVMLYRFTEEWHGMVIAEARAPHMHSYLGHHFPASDIPAQARAVFLQNWVRMIPDVDYTPAALHPGTNPLNGAPLDLSHAMLRSVSPIHLEYLRNMEVKATLTVSLIDEGKLWGLIACHHPTPRMADADSRLGAKMVGQLVSSQIQLKQSLDDLHYRARLRTVHDQLIGFMEQEEDLVQGLVKHTPNMLNLAAAGGAAAAIHHDNHWTIIGKTPTEAQIEQLVDWLTSSHAGESMFCTNRLSKHFPPAMQYKEFASGLLAISIPKSERNYILWFRPEVATTVTWAGNPEKPARQDGDHLTLHPRSSFQSWKEIVEGAAAPWKKVEVEAIADLRNSILALGLQREFRKEQEARTRAERVSREKEGVVHMVSHDLRTPLSIVRMCLEMLQQTSAMQIKPMQELLDRGVRATEAIEHLANDVLNVAKVDAGALVTTVAPESAESLAHEAIDMALPLAEKRDIRLLALLNVHGAEVFCERPRIAQVFSNLIGNALKFTPQGGRITVSAEPEGDQIVFGVADTGIGITAEHLPRIFDRFWQEKEARPYGTGLGLSIVKEIVEKHGGRIWVHSEPSKGSHFFFSLPRKKAPE